MKVLHLTCNDARTGGAKAVHRLHVALLEAGVESRVLLGADEDKSDREHHVPRPLLWRAADKPMRIVTGHTGLHGLARPSFHLWRREIDAFAPDVVHLHWTYSGHSIPLTQLRSLSASYPLVWTFHDMWPITGGCTNSKGCERWKTGCGSCPIIADGRGTGAMLATSRDWTGLQWRIKRRALRRTELTIVAPSSWMAGIVRQSPITRGADVICLPNPIDTDFFSPRNRVEARRRLGLPLAGSVVVHVGKPHSIGFYEGRIVLFVQALRRLRETAPDLAGDVRLLLVGGGGAELLRSSGFDGIALGGVSDEGVLVDCFSAADVMVNTTQYDNLPGVVQEAMSCGLAVIASDVGGLPEMLDGGEAGVLADRSSPAAFAVALETLLRDERLRGQLGRRARGKALRSYEGRVVAPAVLALYERIRSCAR
jgi:glycosyltransferase involved in cell wall biosynthesis